MTSEPVPAADDVRMDLAERVHALSNELIDPLLCRTPAYGVPGHAHCAACCYGTGVIITCVEDQLVLDTAKALDRLYAMLVSPEVEKAALTDGQADG
jgi:hypothetical protein